MTKKEQILAALTTAMKEKDTETRDTLRGLTAAIKNEEIAKGGVLEDEAVEAVLTRQMKQLLDARADFEHGNRTDLLEKTDKEIQLIQTYLPKQFSDAEIEAAVKTVIEAASENGKPNIGAVMGRAMQTLKGRADGNAVRAVVERLLA